MEPGAGTARDELIEAPQAPEEQEATASPFPRAARAAEHARRTLDHPDPGTGAPVLVPTPGQRPAEATIDIVVVTHDSRPHLERHVPALEAAAERLGARLLFVDNASSDGSANWIVARERLETEVIELPENRGYAAAVNAGAARSHADFLVVLNPDIHVSDAGAIQRLISHLEHHPEAAAVAPRLLSRGGQVQPSARPVPTLPMLLARQTTFGRTGIGRRLAGEYLSLPATADDHAHAEWVLGAAIAIRRTDFDRVGGWDERFFLYFEDVDFCFRLRAADRQVHYLPGVELGHDYGRESRRELGGAGRSGARREHLRSAIRFFRKYPHLALRRRRAPVLSSPLVEGLRRCFDILASGIALLVLAPVLLVIAACIKLDSHGPVLFRQKRVGRGLRPFTVLKFRTMENGAESSVAHDSVRRHVNGEGSIADGNGRPVFKCMPGDGVAVTRMGRFLRRWSLDELPQLINVLRGEMTLVGYRPPIAYEIEHYPDWYFGRFVLKPGLTGIWQVSGRSGKSYVDMVRYDIEYVQRRSLRMDLWLLVRTVPAILMRRGAY